MPTCALSAAATFFGMSGVISQRIWPERARARKPLFRRGDGGGTLRPGRRGGFGRAFRPAQAGQLPVELQEMLELLCAHGRETKAGAGGSLPLVCQKLSVDCAGPTTALRKEKRRSARGQNGVVIFDWRVTISAPRRASSCGWFPCRPRRYENPPTVRVDARPSANKRPARWWARESNPPRRR